MSVSGFLLSAVVAAAAAHAASDCREVRLDRPGFSMEKLAIRDQGSLGICYGEVAGQLVDAWRQSHVPASIKNDPRAFQEYQNFQSSGIWAAVNYAVSQKEVDCKAFLKELRDRKAEQEKQNKKQKKLTIEEFGRSVNSRLIDGGYVCPTVNALMGAGLCDRRQVEIFLKKGFARSKGLMRTWDQMDMGEVLRDVYEKDNPAVFCATYSNLQQLPRPDCMSCSPEAVPAVMPHGMDDWENWNATYLWSAKKEVLGVRDYLRLGPCSKSKISQVAVPENVPWRCHHDSGVSKNFQAKISELLTRSNPQPVGVYLCSKVLKNPDSESCRSLHALLVIGQRQKGGKCQFLLRNSWGSASDRKNYHQKWERDLGSDGKPNGQIWIDAETLMNNTTSMIHLE